MRESQKKILLKLSHLCLKTDASRSCFTPFFFQKNKTGIYPATEKGSNRVIKLNGYSRSYWVTGLNGKEMHINDAMQRDYLPFSIRRILNLCQSFLQLWPHFWEICLGQILVTRRLPMRYLALEETITYRAE